MIHIICVILLPPIAFKTNLAFLIKVEFFCIYNFPNIFLNRINKTPKTASAIIHTLQFGNFYREAVGAKSYLGFTNTRGPANTQIQIPLMDKHDTGRRSHYLTVQFSIYDAPGVDEIVCALGAATTGRPHHRIGDRYSDLKALGKSVENPAGI